MQVDEKGKTMTTDVNSLAIWWLSQADCEAIAVDEHAPEGELLPQYLKDEFNSRYGRPGRGRLWIPEGIDGFDVSWPEPETPIAKICGNCGGIVFWRKDMDALSILPGLVTDLFLNRL